MADAMTPFRNPGYAVFEQHRDKVLDEIRNLTNDYVLKASPTELEAHFTEQASLTELHLHFDQQYIADQSGIRYGGGGYRGDFDDGPCVSVAGTKVRIAVPYDGDVTLLHVRPSRYSLSAHAKVEIEHGRILIPFSFPDGSADGQRLKAEVDQALKWLGECVAQLNKDIAVHNGGVGGRVCEALSARRQQALKSANAVAVLGIPMQRKDAPAFAIPTARRPKPVSLPSVQTGTFRPEPFLSDVEYKHILSVTRSMSKVIERSPDSFKTLGEEEIRNHFLIQLNGHYEGQATGETFNAAGKTDILLRYEDRNVFISECKIWSGQKAFDEAIDQLLGYMTWRDCKCALLVFNRNKDSTSVATKMNEVMQGRAEFRKTLSHDVQGDSSYVFVKETEPGRDIVVTTQLYDVPS